MWCGQKVKKKKKKTKIYVVLMVSGKCFRDVSEKSAAIFFKKMGGDGSLCLTDVKQSKRNNSVVDVTQIFKLMS